MRKLHFLTFWAINGALDMEILKRQLLEMKAYGFDGTIFHPRYYPGEPAYMSRAYLKILDDLILYAKELGLEFWIYDENGWPSGSGDGKVLEHFPDSVCEWLEYVDGKVQIRQRNSFNTFNKEEMGYFLEIIYDGYQTGLSEEAFSYVTGFFSDEVGFLDGHGVSMDLGGIPWCEEAEERYRSLYGEEIRECWELLFTEDDAKLHGNGKAESVETENPEAESSETQSWETAGKKEESRGSKSRENGSSEIKNEKTGASLVRYRYWQILSDILAENFYRSINGWCERYGKRYTAHLKGEETLFFQVPCSGSLYRNLMEVNLPAVDALERYPGNHYYPRVASSLSRQFSDGECMAEAFGGSGWGLSPADVEAYIDWLAESGINRFAFHLWQYEKNSTSIRDWPPNIPIGLTWRKAWPELLNRLRARWDGKVGDPNRVLLVAPERAVMAGFRPTDAMCLNEHDGAGTPDTEGGRISESFSHLAESCYRAGLSFDVTNERLLEAHGQVRNGKLYLGKAVYDTVILGDNVCFEDPEVAEQCKACGILREDSESDKTDGLLRYGREPGKTGVILRDGEKCCEEGGILQGGKEMETLAGSDVSAIPFSMTDFPEHSSEKTDVQDRGKNRSFKNAKLCPRGLTEWEYVACLRNQVLIPLQRTENLETCDWNGELPVEQPVDLVGLCIRLQEPASRLAVCGCALDLSEGYEKEGLFYYPISDEGKEKIETFGRMQIELTLKDREIENPFLFAEGRFLVKNRSGYLEAPSMRKNAAHLDGAREAPPRCARRQNAPSMEKNAAHLDGAIEKRGRQWICEDAFYLTGSVRDVTLKGFSIDLVAVGFPFCGSPVTVCAKMIAREDGLALARSAVIHADAARVWIDGENRGFVWGPEWKIPAVAPGLHEVALELYPSTFNSYGPHHHYQGDRALTSPLQYSGVKAFADDDDAPEYTLIPQWHFVKFGAESDAFS